MSKIEYNSGSTSHVCVTYYLQHVFKTNTTRHTKVKTIHKMLQRLSTIEFLLLQINKTLIDAMRLFKDRVCFSVSFFFFGGGGGQTNIMIFYVDFHTFAYVI